MCGITGFIFNRSISNQNAIEIIRKMNHQIIHRGPDDSGFWINEDSDLILGHQRLSILELSNAGSQPMISSTGRYVISFNGEIYNHIALRKKLNFYNWKGSSDTETILECIEEWGLDFTLKQLVGMFAIAIWDNISGDLFLCRDRLGEKPLYYGNKGNIFLFGSELNSLKAHPNFNAEIDQNSLQLYLRNGYVKAPNSIYKGIFKLMPGYYLKVNKRNYNEIEFCNYWNLDLIIREKNSFEFSLNNAVNVLEELLLNSVENQSKADVPLGAFLSGGIDSSLIVALAQSISSTPLNTFTIGSDIPSYNESEYAGRIAKHLGTNHNELIITSKDSLDIIPNLKNIFDEPFADSSQIPTYFVSKLAKSKVKVALSGDGGDELFCGYSRYQNYNEKWKKINSIPYPLRKILGNYLPNSKYKEVLFTKNIDEFYSFMNKQWKGIQLLNNPLLLGKINSEDQVLGSIENSLERMMYSDLVNYLPNDILTKVDRASMSVSLETRVPLLDHNIVEFAWGMPIDYKFYNGENKWPLKQILYKYVPKKLLERPKMGFSVPIENWLRGPLKDWAEDLISEKRLISDNIFEYRIVRKIWNDHLSGIRDNSQAIWTILMFQDWNGK